MNKFRIRKIKEQKIIWMKFRNYIDFVILACCGIIAFNVHPSNLIYGDDNSSNNNKTEKTRMIYVFHDYEWNEYIMNDKIHWSSNSWDYLFDDDIPENLKWEDAKITWSVSLSQTMWGSSNGSSDSIKNNQISINDIMSELWIESNDGNKDNTSLVISVWDTGFNYEEKDNDRYNVVTNEKDNTLTIEKINNEINSWEIEVDKENKDSNHQGDNLLVAKTFTFVEEWWVLPSLVSRSDLYFWNKAVAYVENSENKSNNYRNDNTENRKNNSGIEIIDNYADCMTPWWYKIHHWESVLAYKQMEDTPDFCHIERRFCWKWKLSWTYTQQGCSVNENYTYEQRWDVKVAQKVDDWFNWRETRQNPDWTVSVKDTEIWWGWEWMLDIPNRTSSSFSTNEDNIREEDKWVPQKTRPHRDCTAPRWEKVKHWDFIQAFKHANWFSDAPCEMQIRLCTMGELMWTYTESTCKTWGTSFIDWVNWSPSRNTYSKEKLELVRKQMKAERAYYEKNRKTAEKSTDSESLDRILYILDQ